MLRKLLTELLPVTHFHIREIKAWRNRFTDQAESCCTVHHLRSFPDATGHMQLQALSGENVVTHHNGFQCAVRKNQRVLNRIAQMIVMNDV
ncbi:hypothetical protein D9M72_627850 [compost metagenome]